MANFFRVLLDFCQLNCKSLKYVWMNVSPHELKTIQDFKNLILKKFSLQNKDFQLYLNNGLLLEDESIVILRENDTIRLEYIEPPNLKQNNSSILNMCASNVLNSEISPRHSNEVKFSKKRKRKEITSDIITTESKEAKDSSKKKKHKLSSETSLAESNTAENPSLIEPVNDFAVMKNKNLKSHKEKKSKHSHKEKKSKHSHNESALKSNPSIAVGNEVILIEDISKKSEEDLIPLHCTESKEKASTRCTEIEDVNFVVPCNLKNEEHKSHQKQKKGKHYHDKSAFEINRCNATEKEVILCEEIINISEEDKMSKLAEPKNILETEEQKEDNVVSDCCEVIKETHSSQLYQSNSFTKYNKKNIIEVNQNNQVKFENQDENNKSGNFNADYVGCTITNNSQLIQGNNCKKKRYRHRKRKPHLNNSFNNDLRDESHCSDLFMKDLEDGALSNIFDVVKENAVDKNITENSYKYSPSTKTVKTELSEADNIVTSNIYPTTTCQQRCTLQVFNQNEVLETLGETLNHGNTFKSSSPLTSSRTPSKFNKQKKEEINSNLNKEVINWNSKFICSDCPPLDSFPGVGTPIAFKILELDEFYSPVISHYREGIVTAVNPQTDELEIKLFQPEVKQGKTGKFENLYLDELPSCKVIEKMTLQWSTLINPVRLCSC